MRARRSGPRGRSTECRAPRGNFFALGSRFLIHDERHITPLQPRSLRFGFDWAF
jgi:iron complex outermembrane recepter protein